MGGGGLQPNYMENINFEVIKWLDDLVKPMGQLFGRFWGPRAFGAGMASRPNMHTMIVGALRIGIGPLSFRVLCSLKSDENEEVMGLKWSVQLVLPNFNIFDETLILYNK